MSLFFGCPLGGVDWYLHHVLLLTDCFRTMLGLHFEYLVRIKFVVTYVQFVQCQRGLASLVYLVK